MKGTAISALLLLAIAGLVALQLTEPWHRDGTADPWPVPATGAPAPRLQLGVTTPALARNSYRRWSSASLGEVNTFENDARRHSDVVMWFADWAHVADFSARQARAVAARGSIPEISWEPWDSGAGVRQPRYRLATIIHGDHDAYIRRWARAIAAYGHPVRLRFAHEMNGRWYPWAERANGNRPGEFTTAWRHVHAIFDAVGARNVRWVWSPVAGHVDAGLYPGTREVDVLAVSGFIAASGLFRERWRPFADAFGKTLTTVHRLDPGKPVTLSEIAVAGGDGAKASWIRGMFAEIARRPYVRALVWFELSKEADWRIAGSPRARAAFVSGLRTVER